MFRVLVLLLVSLWSFGYRATDVPEYVKLVYGNHHFSVPAHASVIASTGGRKTSSYFVMALIKESAIWPFLIWPPIRL